MVDIKCPSCASINFSIVMSDCKDILHGVEGVWEIVQCKSCGLNFTTPQLDRKKIGSYYPENYGPYNFSSRLKDSFITGIFRYMSMILYYVKYGDPDWSELPIKNNNLLEIGCGSGMFLKRMGAIGWICHGIDVSEYAVAQSRKNNPSAIIAQSNIEDLNTETKFGLIAFSHVLEHLHNPIETLMICRNMLDEGGKLYIAIPNINSFVGSIPVSKHIITFI